MNDIDEFILALRSTAPQLAAALATAIDKAAVTMAAKRQSRMDANQAEMEKSVKA